MTFDVRRLVADIRQSLVRQSMTRVGSGGRHDWRRLLSHFEALARIDLQVLLLDEPWAAVDAAATEVVTHMMAVLRSTHVVLFTCHGDGPFVVD